MEEQHSPGLTLRAFLRDRRLRAEPQARGLPRRRSGRAGLRREDVAELLDVSLLWYTLFESGTSGRRFSAAFLDRVANVLQLDAVDRSTMMRLVIESDHAARDVEVQWMADRWQTMCAETAEAARRIATAQTAAGAADAALQALRTIADHLGLAVSLPDAIPR
jgi:transcriptional regulator with XRE-family HTH domain